MWYPEGVVKLKYGWIKKRHSCEIIKQSVTRIPFANLKKTGMWASGEYSLWIWKMAEKENEIKDEITK